MIDYTDDPLREPKSPIQTLIHSGKLECCCGGCTSAYVRAFGTRFKPHRREEYEEDVQRKHFDRKKTLRTHRTGR